MPAPPPPRRPRTRNLTEEQYAVLRERAKLWREKNKERANEIARKSRQKYVAANFEFVREHRRGNRLRLRLQVLEFFGGVCVRCGFSDWRALQIDHCNGEGYHDTIFRRGKESGPSMWKLRAFIKANPEKAKAMYQCLCANCNWIKRFENDEHAHKEKRRCVPVRAG